MQERKSRAAKVAWSLVAAAIVFVAVLFILREDDCWPEPEPVPADCKPGQPCPVDGETGGVEVKPLPAAPVEPPTPAQPAPQETTGGSAG